MQEHLEKEKILIQDHFEKEKLSFEKEKLLIQQQERAAAEALEKEKLLIQQQKEVAAETLAREDLLLRQQDKAAALALEDKKMMVAQALEEKKLLIQQQLALQNDNSERERRLIELNEKQKKEEREKIEIENQEKLKLSLQLAEEKRLSAIREAELKAELELEKQLREWEREQQPQLHRQTMKKDLLGDGASQLRAPNTLDSSRVERDLEVTQPAMAELNKSGDMSETSGDLLETSALPPRAILSVSQPTLAQATTLLDCKADSSLQAGACLSQPVHKSQFELSQSTNSPVALHHTPSVAANKILTFLPPAPHHAITNYTYLHGTAIPAHTPLHNTGIPTGTPLSNTPNRGDSVHQTQQTDPSTGPGLAAVAQSTTNKPHTTPDNHIGHMSTASTPVTNLSSPHTPGPVQTSVGENNRHTLPAAVTPVTQNVVTSGVVASQW